MESPISLGKEGTITHRSTRDQTQNDTKYSVISDGIKKLFKKKLNTFKYSVYSLKNVHMLHVTSSVT